MSRDGEVRLNSSEIRHLLRGDGTYAGVVADLKRRAEAIAARAGAGSEAGVDVGTSRARGYVVTATADAMAAEATNRTLTRALDAGR